MAAKRLVSGLLVSLITTTIALGMVEVAMRLLLPDDLQNVGRLSSIMVKDPELGWRLKGGYSTRWMGRDGEISLATNPDGLLPRSALRNRAPGVPRILLLGDSTVMGKDVPESARLHAQMHGALARHGVIVDVVNAAVEGWATDQSLLRLKQLVDLYAPDLVVYGFCLNDLLGNTVDFDNAAKPHFIAGPAGTLTYMPPNDRPVEDSTSHFLHRNSVAYRYFQPTIFNLRVWLGLVSNESQYATLPFWTDQGFLDSREWALFWQLTKEMTRVAEARQARFLLYAHPSLEEVWPPSIDAHLRQLGVKPESHDPFRVERKMARDAKAAGVEFVPMVSYFREHQSEGPFHLLPRDPHSNPVGYRLISAQLSAYILRGHLLR